MEGIIPAAAGVLLVVAVAVAVAAAANRIGRFANFGINDRKLFPR